MKIDLTSREVELILALLSDIAADGEEFDLNTQSALSIEELALIEKLEMALKREELLSEKSLMNLNNNNLLH